jgi:hypothetical protein
VSHGADPRADIASSHPPKCLDGHRRGAAETSSLEHAAEVTFQIACDPCGFDQFELLELHVEIAGGSQSVGLVTRCSKCGVERVLFDQAQHGYDGELGHLSFLKGPRTSTSLRGPAPLRISFVYNSSIEELQETAGENGIAVQDLFDWFRVSRADASGAWEDVWDCECA